VNNQKKNILFGLQSSTTTVLFTDISNCTAGGWIWHQNANKMVDLTYYIVFSD